MVMFDRMMKLDQMGALVKRLAFRAFSNGIAEILAHWRESAKKALVEAVHYCRHCVSNGVLERQLLRLEILRFGVMGRTLKRLCARSFDLRIDAILACWRSASREAQKMQNRREYEIQAG